MTIETKYPGSVLSYHPALRAPLQRRGTGLCRRGLGSPLRRGAGISGPANTGQKFFATRPIVQGLHHTHNLLFKH